MFENQCYSLGDITDVDNKQLKQAMAAHLQRIGVKRVKIAKLPPAPIRECHGKCSGTEHYHSTAW